MKNIYYLFTLLAVLVLLTGCAEKRDMYVPLSPEDAWLSQIDSVQIPTTYTVNYYKTYSSSGGTRIWNYTYYVRDEKVLSCEGALTNSYSTVYNRPCNVSSETFMTATSIKDALSTYNDWMFKRYGDNNCYYNITNPSGDPMVAFVCFNSENNIVSYGGKSGYGGMFILWYMNDYYPNSELYSNN